MTTELESPDELVHDAVPTAAGLQTVPENGLIKFDLARADIEHMRAQSSQLTISGPDDRAGFNLVYSMRQVVKKQRVAVQKKGKELKDPHIAYNRQVDAAMKDLVEPMEQIENALAIKEKAHNDERERIAHEKLLAQQQRTEGRINQLRDCGFAWNGSKETYEITTQPDGHVVMINFDDIKELSDDDYAPTLEMAQALYRAEFERQEELKRIADEEAARIAAEQQAERDQLARDKTALDEQRRALEEQQRLMDEAKAQDEAEHNQRVAERQEAERIKEEKRAQAAQNKSDKERQKRLARDKKVLTTDVKQLLTLPFREMQQPETSGLVRIFRTRLAELAGEFTQQIDGL